MKNRVMSARGATLIDCATAVACGTVLLCLAAALPPSWKMAGGAGSRYKIAKFGEVAQMYRNDHAGAMPIPLTYRRGTTQTSTSGSLEGICSWSSGGKNNSAYWASRAFDVEAVDRPLTQYLYPGFFSAPPPPATLASNSPERQKQADIWRDPGDRWSYQRTWPQANYTISCYDDVGSSYQWSGSWFTQLSARGMNFTAAYNEGMRRFTVGQGVSPSRMIWYADQFLEVVIGSVSTSTQIPNGYGDINKSTVLFMDGSAAYVPIVPGGVKASYSNANYSVIFDDLPNPGF